MKLKLLYFFIICAIGLSGSTAFAQSGNMNAEREAQKKTLDSLREVRMAYADSLREVRQKRADSLKAVREHRESRKYKDSVAKARQHRLDSIKAVRVAYFDSIRTDRKRVTDSIVAVRKARTDSIKAVQQHRADSLAMRRKYRESKRYKDSVAFVRKVRLDSLKAARKMYNDSLIAERRAAIDSMVTARKAVQDSVMAERKKKMDSTAAVRKQKSDSLAKMKEKKVQQRKVAEKKREEKKQLAFELKIKKKREAWSNEKMLKKRWSVPRQVVQNTFTRYNYYFNADKKMDEALANMLRVRKENYDSLLALFPFNPDRDSALLAADMDSIVQKASIGIQIHDPRTKWGDDLYLLLGQAYYYRGSYENASTTFKYIVSLRDKRKKKRNTSVRRTVSKKGEQPSIAQSENKSFFDFMQHRSVHNESILWLSRTYTQAGNPGAAESVLDLLETDPNFPEHMQGRLALERSFIYLSVADYQGAVKQLDVVAKDNNLPDWIRMRSAYIGGQLLQEQGNYNNAIANYKYTLALHPPIDMDFYARKNLAYSSMYAGGSQEEAIATLKKVLNDGKYLPYYEQVYYVMGRLAANDGKSDEAISYLKKSLESSKSTKKQKALSFATLGDVYYTKGEYLASKDAYDSVVVLIASAPDDPIIELSIKRALALGSVTKPLATIHEQDSLLALAALSDGDQRRAIRKYIKMLEDKKADSAFLAENAGMNNALQNQGDANNNNGGGDRGRWYFANPVLMQQGYNEFKRKWGNRPLADNWRRASAISSAGNQSNTNIAANTDNAADNDALKVNGKAVQYDERGLPTEESLLSFIPQNADDKDAALRLIMKSYITLANAYVKELEDYPPAIKTLDTLDKRFPGHPYMPESVYIRYVIALRVGKLNDAQQYSEILLKDYPDSKFADMVRPSESGQGLADMKEGVAEYYELTYKMLLEREYPAVLVRAKDGQRRYSDMTFNKRFIIMEGIALAGTEDYDKADTVLSGFINNYPSDSLRPWADAVLKFVRTNRPPPPLVTADKTAAAPAVDSNAQVPKIQASTPQSAAIQDVQDFAPMSPLEPPPPPVVVPKEYSYNANVEHYVVILIPAMEQRAMGVKAAVSDFNNFKFAALKLQTEVNMLQTDQGLIYTQKFKNSGQAKIYLNSLRSTTQIFREYKPNEYELFIISEENYRKVTADKDARAYLLFYKENYK